MSDGRAPDNVVLLPVTSSGREPTAAPNGTGSAKANPVAVLQSLTDSASLPEILHALTESHLRVMLCIENAVELFNAGDEKLAHAYLEIAAEEQPLLNRVEELLERMSK